MEVLKWMVMSFVTLAVLAAASLTAPSASAESLVAKSTTQIFAEIDGLGTPDSRFVLASADLADGPVIDDELFEILDGQGAHTVYQRSSGCSMGCSSGCSSGCSVGCSVGCTVGCSVGCQNW